MRALLLLVFSLFTVQFSFAADYFWVGDSGNWSDLSHWATQSGGNINHNSIPSSEDNVFFDANSFTGPNQTVTIESDIIFVRSLIFQGDLQGASLIGPASGTLNVFGSFELNASMTFDYQGDVAFQGAEVDNIIDLAGQMFNQNVYFNGVQASWELASALVVGGVLFFQEGIFRSANFQIIAQRMSLNSFGATSGVDFGRSQVILTGVDIPNTTDSWTLYIDGDASVADRFQLANTSFTLNGANISILNRFNFGENGIDRITVTSEFGRTRVRSLTASPLRIGYLEVQNNAAYEDELIVDSLIIGGGKNHLFFGGLTYEIGHLESQGTCEEPTQLISATRGLPVIFSSNTDTILVEETTIRDIHTSGSATFLANNSVDLGNNQGWTINTKSYDQLFWVGGTGMWDNPANWSFTSGGPGGACIPTPGEDVIFDANSFANPMDIVMVNVENAYCKSMIWQGVNGNPTLMSTGDKNLQIFGSLAWATDMTNNFAGVIIFEADTLGQTISTGGNVLLNDVYFEGSGQWTLQDSLQLNTDIYFENGHLNTNDQFIRFRRFYSLTETNRTLEFTNSYILITEEPIRTFLRFEVRTTNLNFDAGTSTIEMFYSGAFYPQGVEPIHFHKVIMSNGGFQGNYTNPIQLVSYDTLIMYGNNYFDNTIYAKHLETFAGYSLKIQPQDTVRFDTLIVNGDCDAFVEIRSEIGGESVFFEPTKNNTISNVILEDIHNNSSFELIANDAVDLGNNLNWTINELAARDLFWVGDGGYWYDRSHWSLGSGGPGGECPPSPRDNVYFDENSFSTAGQSVRADSTSYSKILDWTTVGFMPEFRFFDHQQFGDLIFSDSMTLLGTHIRFRTDSTDQLVDTKGLYFWTAVFEGKGSWVLGDTLNIHYFNHSSGSLRSDSNTIISVGTTFYSDNEKELDISGSHWQFNGSRNLFASWTISRGSNLSQKMDNSLVEFTQDGTIELWLYDGFTFDKMLFSNPSGLANIKDLSTEMDSSTYNHLEIRNNALFEGSFYGDTLILTPGKSYQLDPAGQLRADEYVQIYANNCSQIELRSSTTGQQADLVMDEALVKADFVQMRDIRAVGSVDFYAGNGSIDIDNNTNWIFGSLEQYEEEGFLGIDRALCASSTVELDANNFSIRETYLWQDGSTEATFVTDQPGTYFATVNFSNACTITDTVVVLPPDAFLADLPDTTTFVCIGDTFLLEAGLDLVGMSYLWQDGSTSQNFTVRSPGEYKVSLELTGCTSSDSTVVEYIEYPVFSLGADTTMCADSTLLLNALTDTATYRWLDGSDLPNFEVGTSGVYWVDVAYRQCATRDSIQVNYYAPIDLDLGNDTTICDETNILLGATLAGASYNWSDNSTTETISVDQAGAYFLEVNVNGCPAFDTINIAIQELPRFNLGEDTIICEGDAFLLDGTSLAGTIYEWSDGSSMPTLSASNPGSYALQATLNGCSFADVFNLGQKPLPVFDLGNDTTICEGKDLDLVVTQLGASYLWQDGSRNRTFTAEQAGTYFVRVDLDQCILSDTFELMYKPFPRFELGTDTSICEGESVTFDGTSLAGTTYEWSDGSTNPTLRVSTAGLYALEATLDDCVFVGTRSLEVRPLPIVDLGEDQVLCEEEEFILDVAQQGASFQWQDGSVAETFTVSNTGTYFVAVDLANCILSDTVNFTFNPLPRFELGTDTSICAGESVTFDGTSLMGAAYSWSNGSTDPMITINEGGAYALEATLDNCTYQDSRTLVIRPLPIVDLGADQTLCEEDVFNLDVNQPGATYTWQDGSGNGNFEVRTDGSYFVAVNLEDCIVSDTANFTFTPLPRFELGNDTLLCEGESLTLNAEVPGATYSWNNGSTGSTITVTEEGNYNLITLINGCDFSDEINVQYGLIPDDLLGEDQILCDGEEINFNLDIRDANYQWIDGSASGLYTINSPGTFGVRINVDRCIGGDTINVSYNPLPIFSLGNDTLLCEGDQITLTVNAEADLIQWQDGTGANTLSVSSAGTYRALATLNDCPFTDEINVDYQASRSFSLGPDTTICDEQSYILSVNQRADRITWQDGSSAQNFTVQEAATYFVEVVDGACIFTDTIVVNTRDCFRFRAYKPTAFSPNNDGFNDVFQIGLPPTVQIAAFEMEVYNRWGAKVYQSTDYEKGWNGLLNGEVLPGGVYLYNIRIEYTDDFKSDVRVISGDVLLLR